MKAATDTLTAAVAAYGLHSSVALPSEPLNDGDWALLLTRANEQRLGGLLVKALDDGAWAATDDQHRSAVQSHGEWMRTVVKLEQQLIALVELLGREGLEYRVLKGSALAHLDYPDPSLRCFGDIDLLVRADQFDLAATLIESQGWQRRFPAPRRDFDRRFSKGTSFITGRGREVDLHRTFVAGPFGLRVQLDDLFATADWFTVGGQPLLALGAEERFLHACFHAALGDRSPRLLPLRDVAQILVSTSVSDSRVHELARAWRAEAVMARAVSLAWAELALTEEQPLPRWAAGYQPDRSEQRALRVYTDPSCSYAAQAAAALWALPGLRDRAAYARALLIPDRSYLVAREGTYLRRLVRGTRTMLRWSVRR